MTKYIYHTVISGMHLVCAVCTNVSGLKEPENMAEYLRKLVQSKSLKKYIASSKFDPIKRWFDETTPLIVLLSSQLIRMYTQRFLLGRCTIRSLLSIFECDETHTNKASTYVPLYTCTMNPTSKFNHVGPSVKLLSCSNLATSLRSLLLHTMPH